METGELADKEKRVFHMDLIEMISAFLNVSGEVHANAPANPAEGAAPLEPAPAPAEAEAPAEVHQREELLRSIHAQIKELVRQHCERPAWKKGLSRFPGQAQLYVEGANDMMSELEISAETDTETLREWVESLRRDPNLLKPLIKDHFPD